MKRLLYLLLIISNSAFSMEPALTEKMTVVHDFFQAIKKKDPVLIQDIYNKYKKYIDINNDTDERGRKALSCMILSKSLMGLTLLVNEYHADVNTIDKTDEQYSPLRHAINIEWHEGVITLLKTGANPDMKDNQGFTTMQSALIQGTPFSIQLSLLENANLDQCDPILNFTLLHFAAANNNTNTVQFLLNQKNPPLNKQLTTGFTPLHLAIKAKAIEVFLLLMRADANIEIENKDGQRAIHLATVGKNVTMLKSLYMAKANLNAQNKRGDTPLHIATFMKWDYGINLLREFKARDDIENNKGIAAHEILDENSVYNQFLKFTATLKE